VVIIIYTGKAPKGALSQPKKYHQIRYYYLEEQLIFSPHNHLVSPVGFGCSS
jgi:hypothetical protein